MLARFGGEEFVLALPGSSDEPDHAADEKQALAYADKLREAVLDLHVPHIGSPTDDYLSVSIGVAVILPGNKRSLEGAIQMADEALYQAKSDGRNRICFRRCGTDQFETGRFRSVDSA